MDMERLPKQERQLQGLSDSTPRLESGPSPDHELRSEKAPADWSNAWGPAVRLVPKSEPIQLKKEPVDSYTNDDDLMNAILRDSEDFAAVEAPEAMRLFERTSALLSDHRRTAAEKRTLYELRNTLKGIMATQKMGYEDPFSLDRQTNDIERFEQPADIATRAAQAAGNNATNDFYLGSAGLVDLHTRQQQQVTDHLSDVGLDADNSRALVLIGQYMGLDKDDENPKVNAEAQKELSGADWSWGFNEAWLRAAIKRNGSFSLLATIPAEARNALGNARNGEEFRKEIHRVYGKPGISNDLWHAEDQRFTYLTEELAILLDEGYRPEESGQRLTMRKPLG